MPQCRFLIGVVYPTFESFKAVESVQSKDDTQVRAKCQNPLIKSQKGNSLSILDWKKMNRREERRRAEKKRTCARFYVCPSVRYVFVCDTLLSESDVLLSIT